MVKASLIAVLYHFYDVSMSDHCDLWMRMGIDIRLGSCGNISSVPTGWLNQNPSAGCTTGRGIGNRLYIWVRYIYLRHPGARVGTPSS